MVRVSALKKLSENKKSVNATPHLQGKEIFNSSVFDRETMRKYLAKDAYKKYIRAIEKGETIDLQTANLIAIGLKNWAVSKGASYYSHWFQPLTGTTAEKHDSFFQILPDSDGIEDFSGKALMQQEPDASSFPSGGLRQTHSARGYTIWDPSSPAFIMETGNGKTLCIPAMFVSYTGEALDLKTPLLKSVKQLDKAATAVCHYFDETVKRVTPNLGWEQEYFVMDKALYNARPDLVLCGRTLFGRPSARSQQFDDHYFGSIPERFFDFMVELEQETLKMGIPVKSRHNEVAPSQFEFAPHFEYVNIAADHNQLFMDMLNRVAQRHDLRVLLHEKPYHGINGSGKHNNWSISTDTGHNLLNPTDKPADNLEFLTFFINTTKAVHRFADVMRASIASVGNEHRLGANEAPPAIISLFTGDNIAKALDAFLNDTPLEEPVEGTLELDISGIKSVPLDNTDRNRTSPFPFTGNKFEFRAVGSSVNVSTPMTYLNTIVANQLIEFKEEVDGLIGKGIEKNEAIVTVLRRYLTESEPLIFNGDNYSAEWVEEAKKRGLANIKTNAEALRVLRRPEVIELFEKNNIFSARELEARYNVGMEEYIAKIELETELTIELVRMHFVPAGVNYQNRLIENIKGLQEIGLTEESSTMKETASEISRQLGIIQTAIKRLHLEVKESHQHDDIADTAYAFATVIKPLCEDIRDSVDKLESLVDDDLWPFPKYREMLFLH
jgi:glutamine synthetase